MSKAGRDKGKRAELEFSLALANEVGVRLVRNLHQWRNGGTDLIPDGDPDEWGDVEKELDRWAIEVKRQAKPRLAEWWAQACEQAELARAKPLLAYRLDYQPWRVMVALADLGVPIARAGHEYTAELSVDGFGALVRERALR